VRTNDCTEVWEDVVQLDHDAFHEWLGCVAAPESLPTVLGRYRRRR